MEDALILQHQPLNTDTHKTVANGRMGMTQTQHTAKERPALLRQHHENGATLIAAFGKASADERYEVDKWLMWATCYGPMTWQERCLAKYVADLDELEQTQFAREARE